MSANEDYLDSLLKAAMSSEEKTDPLANENNNSADSSMDANRSLSPEEIAAMFAASENTEEAPATETEPEPEAVVMPVDDDPNRALSPEEIAAMFAASENTEEAPATEAEPEPEAVVTPVDDDPNRALSPEEIAAMFAASENTEEAPATEAEPEPEAVAMPLDDDPNRALSPEEIAAMFAGAESEENSSAETFEENHSEEDEGAFNTLDEMLSDLPSELNFDADLSDLAGFEGANESAAESEEISTFEENKPVEEEMEFDLDGVDDIDALLGLKEMPENYKDERRQEKMAIKEENAESDDTAMLEGSPADLEDQDLSDILELLGGDDSELAEINDILKKSDNNEMIDLDQLENLMPDSDGENESESDNNPAPEKEEKKKKKLFGKKNKESESEEEIKEQSDSDDGGSTKKEKGFLAKLFESLTAEVEDDEETEQADGDENKKNKKKKKKGKKQADSNEEILDELSEEDAKGKIKEKKPKKEKKKKEKKPKKEKIKPVEEEDNSKKLPKKMVVRIFVLCFSILAVIILVNIFIPKMISLQNARNHFYQGDYKYSYKELISQDKLNESDSILLQKAESLMKIQNKLDLYYMYQACGNKVEGLNALFEGAEIFQNSQEDYTRLGILFEAESEYNQILLILKTEYEIEKEQIDEILKLDLVAYTYRIRELAGGNKPVESISDNSIPDIDPTPDLNDVLDEEMD